MIVKTQNLPAANCEPRVGMMANSLSFLTCIISLFIFSAELQNNLDENINNGRSRTVFLVVEAIRSDRFCNFKSRHQQFLLLYLLLRVYRYFYINKTLLFIFVSTLSLISESLVTQMDDLEQIEEDVPMLVEVPESKVIPVTIITGYLGSGKSTLLNFLMRANHGKRIAIIENEFGAGLGIEGMIAKNGLDNSSLEGFFELNNGCICCTVKDDLLVTLEQLVLHKDRFDYIIIETTGVANPGPVISTFWTDESLGSCLKLDGVVCMVDSSNFDFYMTATDTASDVRMQISYADRILLNKSDLVGADKLSAVESAVLGMNSMAEILKTSFAECTPDWVLGIDCYSLRAPSLGVFGNLCSPCDTSQTNKSSATDTLQEQVQTNANSEHTAASFSSSNFSFEGPLDLRKVKVFMDTILYNNGQTQGNPGAHALINSAEMPLANPVLAQLIKSDENVGMQIFRIKGVLHSHVDDCLHVLQAVHQTFDIQPSSFTRGSPGDLSGGLNHIIVIGRSLDAAALLDGFKNCAIV